MPKPRPKPGTFADFPIDYTPLRRIRRGKFEMTMEQLAHAVGVHPSTIYRVETNQQEPSHRLLLSLARALGHDHRELYELPGDGH